MTASCCSSVSRLAIRSSVSSFSSSPLRWAIAARRPHSSVSLPQDQVMTLTVATLSRAVQAATTALSCCAVPSLLQECSQGCPCIFLLQKKVPSASPFILFFARLRDVTEESSLGYMALLEQRAQGQTHRRAVLYRCTSLCSMVVRDVIAEVAATDRTCPHLLGQQPRLRGAA